MFETLFITGLIILTLVIIDQAFKIKKEKLNK